VTIGLPLGGFGGSATGLVLNQLAVVMASSGTTTLSTSATASPLLVVSSATLTAAVTLDFSTNCASGFWVVDCTALNGGATLTTFGITFKNGTTSVALAALPTGKLVIVSCTGTNLLAIN
jgi:hypothetical protein